MQKTLSVVNLTAIENNAKLVKNMLNGQKFYAVVKANAYGHGAERVALSLQHIVDGFCVAIAEEGAALRIAGITKPILVLIPPLSEYDVERLTLYGLTATVSNKFAAKLCKNVNCHVKINTGMNRLGCNISELYSVLNELNPQNVKGVYSHLYAPNCKKLSHNQLKIFNEAERIVKSFSPNAIAHIAASGGILRGNDFLKNGVRCGILLYGYAPKGFKLKGLLPALKVYARLTQTTKFIGGGIGYAKASKNYQTLGCYRLGYADGFLRSLGVGESNLCMDAFISQKRQKLLPVLTNAERLAKRNKTISYEILSKATLRSEIVYVR